MEENSDKQVDNRAEISGISVKIRSYGDAAFGNFSDKDLGKDEAYFTVGKLGCLEGEEGAISRIAWLPKETSRVIESASAVEIITAGVMNEN